MNYKILLILLFSIFLIGCEQVAMKPDKIETKIHKWRYAKPKQVLNYFFKKAKHNPNLLITGEIFGGAKLEGAFLSGINTANYLVNNS